jgi:hypothetical protein
MVMQSFLKDQKCLKSPFEKGGFRGISDSYIIPPHPPLEKGGIKGASNQAQKSFFHNLLSVRPKRADTQVRAYLVLCGPIGYPIEVPHNPLPLEGGGWGGGEKSGILW